MLDAGVRCTEALTTSTASPAATVTDLQRAVEDLDQAIAERWEVPLRAGSYSQQAAVREEVLKYANVLRADYAYHRPRGQLNRGRLVGPLLRWLFHSKTIERKLTAFKTKQIEQARQKRFESYALNHSTNATI
jgi:hypothetical protein